jgi:hypothetical protein
MDRKQLRELILSWQHGDCLPGVLLDALSEFGFDTDTRSERWTAALGETDCSLRDHLLGAEDRISCSVNGYDRIKCIAMERILQGEQP